MSGGQTMPETKILVLDDDPTGSQTVHGCLLLTRWDVATLRQALDDTSPLFFVLTNSNAMVEIGIKGTFTDNFFQSFFFENILKLLKNHFQSINITFGFLAGIG